MCDPRAPLEVASPADPPAGFYEEDEDPARVHALFDAAEREGRLRLTGKEEAA
jgi:hypothetical protein